MGKPQMENPTGYVSVAVVHANSALMRDSTTLRNDDS